MRTQSERGLDGALWMIVIVGGAMVVAAVMGAWR